MADNSLFQQTCVSLLDQLTEMPLFLERTTVSLPDEVLQRQPVGDQFPLIEHLWHIRDCDPDLYALRIRKVLHEERPRLDPVDVGSWYAERCYRERSGNQAVEEFSGLRATLKAELEGLEVRAFARVGIRSDGTEINVMGLVRQILEHDRDHRWRIASILREFAVNA